MRQCYKKRVQLEGQRISLVYYCAPLLLLIRGKIVGSVYCYNLCGCVEDWVFLIRCGFGKLGLVSSITKNKRDNTFDLSNMWVWFINLLLWLLLGFMRYTVSHIIVNRYINQYGTCYTHVFNHAFV